MGRGWGAWRFARVAVLAVLLVPSWAGAQALAPNQGAGVGLSGAGSGAGPASPCLQGCVYDRAVEVQQLQRRYLSERAKAIDDAGSSGAPTGNGAPDLDAELGAFCERNPNGEIVGSEDDCKERWLRLHALDQIAIRNDIIQNRIEASHLRSDRVSEAELRQSGQWQRRASAGGTAPIQALAAGAPAPSAPNPILGDGRLPVLLPEGTSTPNQRVSALAMQKSFFGAGLNDVQRKAQHQAYQDQLSATLKRAQASASGNQSGNQPLDAVQSFEVTNPLGVFSKREMVFVRAGAQGAAPQGLKPNAQALRTIGSKSGDDLNAMQGALEAERNRLRQPSSQPGARAPQLNSDPARSNAQWNAQVKAYQEARKYYVDAYRKQVRPGAPSPGGEQGAQPFLTAAEAAQSPVDRETLYEDPKGIASEVEQWIERAR